MSNLSAIFVTWYTRRAPQPAPTPRPQRRDSIIWPKADVSQTPPADDEITWPNADGRGNDGVLQWPFGFMP